MQFLANIARGSVVDEQALINTLKAGKIFAAGLDVYVKEPLQESELFALENVNDYAACRFCDC